jgi:hypothetical protein
MGRLTTRSHTDRKEMAFEYTPSMIFRGADCDTDHCLVVAEVRERLALSKLGHRSLRWKDLISGS